MKIVCVGDTHREYWKLNIPQADVFVHCGDIDIYEFLSEAEDFNKWLSTLPCKHKIVVAGNHDGFIDRTPKQGVKEILNSAIYLENEGCTIDGVSFWGSPYTNIFGRWYFMLPEDMLKKEWEKIPVGTDVLITHGPPDGIRDFVEIGRRHVGSVSLKERIKKVKPKIHVFGHIHSGYGITQETTIVADDYKFDTTYINASVMDEGYCIANKPVEVYYYKETGDVVI